MSPYKLVKHTSFKFLKKVLSNSAKNCPPYTHYTTKLQVNRQIKKPVDNNYLKPYMPTHLCDFSND